MVAESNRQVPLLSPENFLVSRHHAISSASVWSIALTFFHQETEDSHELVFRKTEKSRGSLGQDKLTDGGLGLEWFGRQGRAGVFGAGGASRPSRGGPQDTGAGRVGGLGGGMVASLVGARWSPAALLP